MSTARIPFRHYAAILTVQPDFNPGDPPPPDGDYLGWHEWAEVQHKAGLRQVQCGRCMKWRYPQELSDQRREYTVHLDKAMTKPKTVSTAICKGCAP